VKAHLTFSWEYPFKEQSLMIIGEDGSLEFDGRCNRLVAYMPNDIPRWIRTDSTEPLLLECQAFIDACEDREDPLTDGISGLHTIKVLHMASMSMVLKARNDVSQND
ncbi:MAG: hypothetical protein ACR2PS_11800, partial [Pseudomonadales bacterium]